jgi:mannose-6-phosphate isomerase-like protein (cupin superfamily)
MDKVNLTEKFAQFSEHWSPKIVAELNGQAVKLVKIHGEFVWHHHDHEDELFFVVKGTINEGELIVVPRGVEHRPVAEDEVHLLLFEPVETVNTGNVTEERTRSELDRI